MMFRSNVDSCHLPSALKALGLFTALLLSLASVGVQAEPDEKKAVATNKTDTTATIYVDKQGPIYDKLVFTQFAEHLGTGIYGGLWVGNDKRIPNTRGFRNDVVDALKELDIPAIRWPGGCFADEYHWREGIGPQAKRPVKINTHWGGVTESNAVGTHEFMDLTEQLGAQAYISGNVGNGTAQEMAEWVEYMTAKEGTLAELRSQNGRKDPWAIPFWGLGNELWGCGGNMRAEYAADETRRFARFVKVPKGTKTIKIASGANAMIDDYDWTDTMMRVAADKVDAISIHYYTMPGGYPATYHATEFDENIWTQTLYEAWKMDDITRKHIAIMDKYDPKKRVFLAIDEWGTWYAGDPGTNPGFLRQQNTVRDALVAAIHLNIFAKYADRVKMTAIAQMVNVLQAMILTDGPKMVLTPTYHVYAMYKPFMDATVLPMDIDSPIYRNGEWALPVVTASAVRAKDGHIYVALTNANPSEPVSFSAALSGLTDAKVAGTVLTGPAINSLNNFDTPDVVKPRLFHDARVAEGKLVVKLPARSVVMLQLQ